MRARLRKRTKRRRILLLTGLAAAVVVLAIIAYVLALPPSETSIRFEVGNAMTADSPGTPADPCSGQPFAAENITADSNAPIANYDEQIWAIASQNTNSLSYNVTAVEQSDASGYGPAYLVNGYTDTGYWYQIGIAWHWVTPSYIGYLSGFTFFIQVYHGNSQLVNYLSPLSIHGGDKVALQMRVSKSTDQVVTSAYDWNTGASNHTSVRAFGATEFVGNLLNTDTPTGLLVEAWGHNLVCGLNTVTFSSESTHPGFGLRVDEWNFTGVQAQDRFQSGNPNWSWPVNGVAPALTTKGCITYLGTMSCASTH